MNKAILIGRLTREPEHNTIASGAAYCRFTLAINRRFADANGNRQADFINVIAWRQLADLCARYLAKGRRVCVVGQIQTRSYDAQDGSKRYVTEVVADEVEFLSSQNGAQGVPPPEDAPHEARSGFVEVDDDEMPF